MWHISLNTNTHQIDLHIESISSIESQLHVFKLIEVIWVTVSLFPHKTPICLYPSFQNVIIHKSAINNILAISHSNKVF